MLHLPFADRLEAGRLLAAEIKLRKFDQDAVILALTRGGVPVGFEVADRLRLPLDVIVARKIGVPWQPELAMGAVAGTERILDNRIIQELGIAAGDVEEFAAKEQAEVRRRETLYRGGEPPLDLDGRSAILIDDGMATGSTMLAALRHTRTLKPKTVVVAVPVASGAACRRVAMEADGLVCLVTPKQFVAVGEWYRDFEQVSDGEVRHLLAESRQQLRSYHALAHEACP